MESLLLIHTTVIDVMVALSSILIGHPPLPACRSTAVDPRWNHPYRIECGAVSAAAVSISRVVALGTAG
jgi:hypothetical protein